MTAAVPAASPRMGLGVRARRTALARRLVRARELVPLTNLGLLVACASLAAYALFGVPHADYVVQLASALGLALVVLSAAIVAPAAWVLSRRLARRAPGDPVLFEAQRGFATTLRVPSLRALPVVEITWSIEDPLGPTATVRAEGRELVEVLESEERAASEFITRRFLVEDAFGLARISFRRTERRAVQVLPFTGRLGSQPVLRSFTSGDELSHPAGELVGDRYDMRAYVPGDPLRLVLWKVFARTRELVVRTPERAISPSLKILAYLPASTGDEPAAALALVSVESGALGEGWLLGVDGHDEPIGHVDRARVAIVRSRAFRDAPGGNAAGLARFLAAAGSASRSRLVVFAPARPGPWVDEVATAIRRWPGASTVALATDGIEPERERGGLLRIARIPEGAAKLTTTTPELLRGVTTALSRAGAHVIVVDRTSGKLIASEPVRRSA
ncbi:MAG: DUF58 domain-containing protein [Deltaproteobacteria bacterium]|nr:DUF58 domain-containing protein [Deltaproteobacteria bacterium]